MHAPSIAAPLQRVGIAPDRLPAEEPKSSALRDALSARRNAVLMLQDLGVTNGEGDPVRSQHAPALRPVAAEDRFRRLLSDADWRTLPETTQRRFTRKVAGGESLLYRGVTTHLRMTAIGRLIAQAARLIGAPLPLDARSEARPAVVAVTAHPSGDGQVWTRIYARGAGFPQMVNSVKRFSGPTGLEEHVGGGVSMSLVLAVEKGALLFCSAGYHLHVLGRRFRIPRVLAPGAMVIGHHDRGACGFDFTLTLTHPVFGVLIEQTTHFTDMEEARYD